MNDDVKRTCPACDAPLIQQRSESPGMFKNRKHCNRECANSIRRHPREHGTKKGVSQHVRRREPLCGECQPLADQTRSEWRAANPGAVAVYKARAQAQRRAWVRLAEVYRAQFLELRAEEYKKAGLS